jgi:hypothetical protein
MTLRWSRWVLLAGGLSIATAGLGCGKKSSKKDDSSESEEKPDKSTKKKKGDGDEEKYARGDVLKHMPKSCKGGRFYLNLGLLLKNEAVESNASLLAAKLSKKMKKKDEKSGKALEALKKAGIDPAKDVKEIALCGDVGMKDFVVAIGGTFSGKDPLGAIKKAGEEGDEKLSVQETDDGVKYLKSGKAYVALVSPNVLVITRDKDGIDELKKDDDESGDWDAEKGRIVSFKVKDKRTGDVTGSITESGDDLDFKVGADLKDAEKMKEDPEAFKGQLEAMLAQVAKKLKKGPFGKVAGDVAAAKIKVSGSKLSITCTVPSSDLGDAIKQAAESSDEDLDRVVDL